MQKGFEVLRTRIVVSGLVCYGLLIFASIAFFDRALSRFAASFHLYEGFLASPPVTSPILVSFLVVAVPTGAVLLSNRLSVPEWARFASRTAILAGLAMSWGVCLTEFVLKPIFARHETFDYLAHGIYGFVWFSRAANLGSFPSGHAVQITSLIAVLWKLYPKARVLYLLAVLLVAVALILAERHFLSDILAGSLIGVGAGVLMVRIWRADQVAWTVR